MSDAITRYLVAAATTDGVNVDQHFGRADAFRIFEVCTKDSGKAGEEYTDKTADSEEYTDKTDAGKEYTGNAEAGEDTKEEIRDTGEVRRVAPACHGGSHEDSHLAANARAIADCKYVLVVRIGNQAEAECYEAGVIPMEIPGDIRAAIRKIRDYEKIQALFE